MMIILKKIRKELIQILDKVDMKLHKLCSDSLEKTQEIN